MDNQQHLDALPGFPTADLEEFLLCSPDKELENYADDDETLGVNLFPETIKVTDSGEVILYSGLFPDNKITLFTDAHGEHDNSPRPPPSSLQQQSQPEDESTPTTNKTM